jgi:hypothetical protein
MRYAGLIVALVVATSAQAGNVTLLIEGQTLENFQEYTHGVETYSQTNVWSYNSFLTVTIGNTCEIDISCANFGGGNTEALPNVSTQSVAFGPPSYASGTVMDYNSLAGITLSTVSMYDPTGVFARWTPSIFATAEVRLDTINEFGNGDIIDLKFTTVPEPTSIALMGTGLLAVLSFYSRSKKK